MMSKRLLCVVALSGFSAFAACDDGGSGALADAGAGDTDAGSGQGSDAQDAGDTIEIPPVPEGGAQVAFDPASRFTRDAEFFEFPFPSDLRRDADGTITLDGIPNPTDSVMFEGLAEIAGDMTGFSSLAVAWFRFDTPVGPDALAQYDPDPSSAIQLVNIDRDSPGFGTQVPVWARRLPTDTYTPDNILGISARPGFVLAPDTTYAFVVLRSLNDAQGEPLGVPSALWELLWGGTPAVEHGADLASQFGPLLEVLDNNGVGRDAVAAATVFTTADEVARTFAITEQIRADHDGVIADLAVDPEDGSTHPRFCELHGTLTAPQFQQGEPPFNSEGLFAFDANGDAVVQRTETFPIVINLPLGEMPAAGFPMALYFHGSGGVAEQVVDRGPILEPGGAEQPGEGPAHVLAFHGIASIGSAHPVNPERVPGASDIAYLNFANLKSFRDIFRQGAVEQRLLLDALLELEIEPSTVAACAGLSLPSGVSTYRFDPDHLIGMGQSMGGMYTNMVGAIEPRIQIVVPTGAGGFWSQMILVTDLIPGVTGLVAGLLGTESEALSYMHPALHTLQEGWEAADPYVYVTRLAENPLPGHPRRSIYEPVGLGDSYFDPEIFDGIAIAYGNHQAGDIVWQSLNDALAMAGRGGTLPYPVYSNRGDETPWTGVVVAYEGDGFTDPHGIYAQLDAVKHQYGCFLQTWIETGVAVVPAPAELGTPCATAE